MRTTLLAISAMLALSACASQTSAPTAPAAATPSSAPAAAAPKAPQCYNGDSGKFVDLGTNASISGVTVVCEKTADGKSAQWMGKKH